MLADLLDTRLEQPAPSADHISIYEVMCIGTSSGTVDLHQLESWEVLCTLNCLHYIMQLVALYTKAHWLTSADSDLCEPCNSHDCDVILSFRPRHWSCGSVGWKSGSARLHILIVEGKADD